MLGPHNFTPFGNDLLTSIVDMTTLILSKQQKLYFNNLQKTSGTLSSSLSPHIAVENMTTNFRKRKEITTTPLSHRHLRHYKSFLVSDSNHAKPEHIAFDNAILQTINTILNATIASGVHLTGWLTSLVVMIEKILAVLRI